MEKCSIALIIPMYNESKIIANTATVLDGYMRDNFEKYEIIFSDDGSTDGCGEVVRSLQLPNVRVVGYSQNKGKGSAVRNAMLSANGDIAMFIDADLAYGVGVIKRAYDIMVASPEVGMIIGSRNLSKDGYSGYTALRRVASKVYIKLLGAVGGFKLSDSQCGCKAFRGKASKEIFKRCEVNGFAFDFECILFAQKLGIKISEMPVTVINHRSSTIHVFKDTFKMLRDIRRIKKHVKKYDE